MRWSEVWVECLGLGLTIDLFSYAHSYDKINVVSVVFFGDSTGFNGYFELLGDATV